MTPLKPDSRASSGVMSAKLIDSIESISIEPFVHRVAGADADVRPLPDADAARDLAAANALAKPLGEDHGGV